MKFIELRLVSQDNSYVLLPRYKDLTFDSTWGPDPSTITFSYPLAEAVSLGIVAGAFIDVCPDGTPIHERYVLEGKLKITVTDEGLVSVISGRSYLGVFEDDFVWPSAWPSAKPTGHAFIDSTAGTIIKTFLTRTQARGFMPMVIHSSFTGAVDSGSTSWGTIVDRNFSTGTTVLQVLQDLFSVGMINVRTYGFELKVYIGGALERHLSEDTVVARAGLNITDESQEESAVDFASDVLVEGEEGYAASVTDAGAYSTIGRRRAKYVGAGGIADNGTLTVIGDASLGQYSHLGREQGLGLRHLDATATLPQPFVDYFCGDWIWVDRADGAKEELQIKQISIQSTGGDASSISVGLTVGDLLDSAEEKLKRRVDAITGGNSGSYGPIPGTTGADRLPPATPNTPNLVWNTYIDHAGFVQCSVTVSVAAVTTNSDGTPASDIGTYEFFMREDDAGADWQLIGKNDTPVTYFSPIPTLAWRRFAAVCIDTGGLRSEMSAEVRAQAPGDTTPTDPPSTPSLTSKLGTITVAWDGKTNAATEMATAWLDFVRVDVHMSNTTGFTPSSATKIGYFTRKGSLVVTGQTGGETRYFKLVSYDTSGNASTASTQASIVVLRIQGPDIEANTVTANEIKAGTITGELIHIGVLGSNLIADPSFEGDYALTLWDPFGGSTESGGVWQQGETSQWRHEGDAFGTYRDETGLLSRSGTKAMVVGVAGSNGGGGVITTSFPVEAGQAYRLVIHVASADTSLPFTVSVMNSATENTNPFQVLTWASDTGWSYIPVATWEVAYPMANAIENWQFDEDESAWTATNCTLTRVAATAGHGQPISGWAGRVTVTSNANPSSITTPTGTGTSATAWAADTPIEVSYSVYPNTTGITPHIILLEYNSSGTLLTPSQDYTATAASAGAWARRTHTFTTKATTAFVQAVVSATGTAGGQTWDVTAIYMGIPGLFLPRITPESFQERSYTFEIPDTPTTNFVNIRLVIYGTHADPGRLVIDDVSVIQRSIGGASEISPAGLRLFDDEGYEVAAFVSNRRNFLQIGGQAAITEDGDASFQQLGAVGTDQGDSRGNTGISLYGTEFRDWIDSLPRGRATKGVRDSNSTSTTTTEIPVLEVQYYEYPDREYTAQWAVGLVNNTTAGRAIVHLRRTTDGSTPGITSTDLRSIRTQWPVGNATFWNLGTKLLGHTAAEGGVLDVRLLLSIIGESGTVYVAGSTTAPSELWVDDSGLWKPDTGIDRTVGSPPSTKKTYVSVFTSTNHATYRGNGTRRTDTTDVVQGYNSYNGDGKGLWIFPSMTSDLSGSTVSKIEVYAYANSWWNNSGGTALIKVHGHASVPGSSPTLTTALSASGWGNPAGRWVTLPSSLYAGFVSGTYKGFGLGPSGGTNLLYYGRFNGSGAQIRVTYLK